MSSNKAGSINLYKHLNTLWSNFTIWPPKILGNFGMVWEGRMRIGPYKEVNIAIKKIRGECV